MRRKVPDDPGEIERRFRELDAKLGRPPQFKEPSAAERSRMVAPPKSSRKGRRGKVLSLVIAVVVVAGLGAAAYGLSRVTRAKVPGSADQAPGPDAGQPGGAGRPGQNWSAPARSR